MTCFSSVPFFRTCLLSVSSPYTRPVSDLITYLRPLQQLKASAVPVRIGCRFYTLFVRSRLEVIGIFEFR